MAQKRLNTCFQSIGVELEGGWTTDRAKELADAGVRLYGDGSVRGIGSQYQHGEIQSPAMYSWPSLVSWVDEFYPCAVNYSCGLHVHLKAASNGLYSALMDEGFKPYFLNHVERWAKKQTCPMPETFWKRWRGTNEFCKREYDPDAQAALKAKGHHRYGIWNFCHGVHHTAECRMLPMFDSPDSAVDAIKAVVAAAVGWLRQSKPLEADDGTPILPPGELAALVEREREACPVAQPYDYREKVEAMALRIYPPAVEVETI